MAISVVNHPDDICRQLAAHPWLVVVKRLETLGTRLSAAMERAGLKQTQLAEDTGVQQSRISDLVRDKRTSMDARHMHALCKRLGITVEHLLEGTQGNSADEAEAVALLRSADPELREAAMNALRGMLSRKARGVAASH